MLEIARLDLASDLTDAEGQRGDLLVTAKVQAWARSEQLLKVWVTVAVTPNASEDSKTRLVLEVAAEKLQQRHGIDVPSLEDALDNALARYGRMTAFKHLSNGR